MPCAENPAFLYKAAPVNPALIPAVIGLSALAVPQALERGVPSGGIDVLSLARVLWSGASEGQEGAAALAALLAGSCVDGFDGFEVVFCEYARPHSDSAFFAGSAFVSLVLHTGPSPYRIEAFAVTGSRRNGFELVGKEIVVGVGDCFVLDPKIPHAALPVETHEDNFLVLLQLSVDLKRRRDYVRLLKRLTPVAESSAFAVA